MRWEVRQRRQRRLQPRRLQQRRRRLQRSLRRQRCRLQRPRCSLSLRTSWRRSALSCSASVGCASAARVAPDGSHSSAPRAHVHAASSIDRRCSRLCCLRPPVEPPALLPPPSRSSPSLKRSLLSSNAAALASDSASRALSSMTRLVMSRPSQARAHVYMYMCTAPHNPHTDPMHHQTPLVAFVTTPLVAICHHPMRHHQLTPADSSPFDCHHTTRRDLNCHHPIRPICHHIKSSAHLDPRRERTTQGK